MGGVRKKERKTFVRALNLMWFIVNISWQLTDLAAGEPSRKGGR